MSELYNRLAILEVGQGGGTGVRAVSRRDDVAEEGIRIAFEVQKTIHSSANTATIQVYNLAPATRGNIVKGNVVRLQAGYGDEPELIYEGEVSRSIGERQGPEIVTTIECGDGLESFSAQSIRQVFPTGTSVRAVVLSTAKRFTEAYPDYAQNPVKFNRQPKKKKASRLSVRGLDGDLSSLERSLKEQGFSTLLRDSLSLSGNAREVMDKLSRMWRFNWSAQDGAIQVVPYGQALVGSSAILLSPGTGLIGAPTVTDFGVKLTAQLIPGIRPGSSVQVQSEAVNGNFRVETVRLQGDTRGQDWLVEIEARTL